MPATSITPDYAELHCLSAFSFLRGASQPEELVHRAKMLGYAALAVTDECSLAGIVRAHLAAKEAGLALVIGSECELADGTRLVLLAHDRPSYGDLAQLITRGRRRATKGSYRLTRDDVAALASSCLALWLPQLEPGIAVIARDAPDRDTARWVRETFADRAWIGVELFVQARDRERLVHAQVLSKASRLPLVAAGDVHMHVRARRALQDTLTAIRLRTPVAACGHALHSNGERHLRSRARLAAIYPRELIAETVVIARRCTFSLDTLRYEYPEELVPPGETPTSRLRARVEQGLSGRYGGALPGTPPGVRKQIEYELALIAELRYEPYFLTVDEIVAFARSRGILCQGRGSAANSAVCYALGITEVDPARNSMLFERFISRERNEPPDIDVDFEHRRREEVIQHIYEKYGRHRAALAATLITYQPKSALRDVGRALGLGVDEVDRLAGAFAWWDGRAIHPDRVREAGFDPDLPVIGRLMTLAGELLGFPRHLSQHVGGFVIARDSLERLVPIEDAAMEHRTVIQWDKDDLDAMGLLKVDCLALGMLSAIRRAFDLIDAENRDAPRFSMQDIPPEDPAVYEMIQRADTIGVFQIESRAQMSMLPRLLPRTFYDLVIEVAIVRPGPIQGGMVHPYLKRRQGLEAVTYPSEAVEEALERTLGVPIFQEQVMQLAIVAAGFTPGEADQLRRSMAAWKRHGDLHGFEERLVEGMEARGYDRKFAQQIYRQILGFGEYGFPESHAVSFALLAYVSAWLKLHAPAAFCAALLDSQPMGFYKPAQLVQDARRHGVEVRAPDVAASDWDCTLERSGQPRSSGAPPGPALRLGLRMVGGLSEQGAQRVVAARRERAFAGVADLAARAGLEARDLDALADGGALASIAGDRHAAAWSATGIERLPPLLTGTVIDETPPPLPTPTEGQDIVADYRRLGLTLRRHPLALLRGRLAARRLVTSRDVHALPAGRLVRTAGIVIGRQRPDTKSGVVFVTLEDETGNTNVIVWRDLGDRQRRELLGARLMAVYGKVEREGIVVHVLARHLVDLTTMLGALETQSRDFH